MATLFYLLQALFAALVLTAFFLGWHFHRIAKPLIATNSRRLNGSWSDRRFRIEYQSFYSSIRRLLTSLMGAYVMIVLIGLLTVGLTDLIDYKIDLSDSPLRQTSNSVFPSGVGEFQWPLFVVFGLLCVFVLPAYVVRVCKREIGAFKRACNLRWVRYYQGELVKEVEINQEARKLKAEFQRLEQLENATS